MLLSMICLRKRKKNLLSAFQISDEGLIVGKQDQRGFILLFKEPSPVTCNYTNSHVPLIDFCDNKDDFFLLFK